MDIVKEQTPDEDPPDLPTGKYKKKMCELYNTDHTSFFHVYAGNVQ